MAVQNPTELTGRYIEHGMRPPTELSGAYEEGLEPPNPTVTTNSASDVTSSTAILNGTLDNLSGESSVDVYFEWGTSTSYGSTTTAQTKSSLGSFSESIGGLTAGTTYHFRAVVTDGVDTWYGADVSFTTTIEVSGTVTEDGNAAERTVRLYNRGTGALVAETTSSSVDGTFSFDESVVEKDTEYYIIALDDILDETDYNALIYDRVTGV